jgi:hypothetical protein
MRAPEPQIFDVLVPFNPAEACSLQEAAYRSGKSASTVRNWCLNHGIGRRVAGGVWLVSKPALEMLLDGNEVALAAYHNGDRTSELVAPYFARGMSALWPKVA